ncbi:MAG: hypothetical protein GXY61_04600 [Lentisphaerae bacterium]|nr:hypothetical protein [Lentisphaerota bacterium]
MKKCIRILMRLLLTLVLLLVLALAFVQSPPGKKWIAAELSKRLSDPGRMEVRIGTLRGWIPMQVKIDHIEVLDQEGVWITSENLRARLSLSDLLNGRLHVPQLIVSDVDMVRRPLSNARKQERSGLERLFLHVESVEVEQIQLAEEVAGVPLSYAVYSGQLSLVSGLLSGEVELGGDAEGLFSLEASLLNPDTQAISVFTDSFELHHPTYGLEGIAASGALRVDALGVNALLDARFVRDGFAETLSTRLGYVDQVLRADGLRWSRAGLELTGEAELVFSSAGIGLQFDGAFDENSTSHYEGSGRGRVVLGKEGWSAEVDALSVTAWSNVLLTASGRLEVSSVKKSWSAEVDALNVSAWSNVVLAASGSVDAERIDLGGTVGVEELGRLPFPGMAELCGAARGVFSLSGPLNKPEGSAEIWVSGLGGVDNVLATWERVNFKVDASLSNGTLSASTALDDLYGASMAAEVSVPLRLSLLPFKFSLENQRLSGALRAALDLAELNQFNALANQRVSGRLTADLYMREGAPFGSIQINDGAYEHYGRGILFHGFNAQMDASPEGLVLREASATDGHKGELFLSGGLSRSGWNVALELKQAKILRLPEASATISGRMKLSGKAMHPELTGELVLDRADVLPDHIAPAKPQLLTNFDASQPNLEPQSQKRPFVVPFGVDLRVKMPGQVFVNADLIDSVWSGDLRIRSSEKGWIIEGKMEPENGFFDFVGRPFRFKGGAIEFDGSVPPVPVFNELTAEYSRSDVSARLILNGTLSEPQYRLESTPAMPEDEILAHVLYNRSSGSISPWQAVQIAQALRQLSGGLSGPGFIYQLRRTIGIDTFEVREGGDSLGESAVVAGKYLAPGLYLEVSGQLKGNTETGVRVEYQISRHFSLETSAGPSLRPGIMLNWKLDY